VRDLLHAGEGEGEPTMTLVLLTAVSVWILMLVMDALPVGGFLLESTIAVIGGALIGFFGAWFLRRRNRKNR
jgi:LPXTG-motif cell wall-anchored protein